MNPFNVEKEGGRIITRVKKMWPDVAIFGDEGRGPEPRHVGSSRIQKRQGNRLSLETAERGAALPRPQLGEAHVDF